MYWFSPRAEGWGAPVNSFTKRGKTPVGYPCFRCSKPIELWDNGFLLEYFPEAGKPVDFVPWHLGCMLANVGVGEIGGEDEREVAGSNGAGSASNDGVSTDDATSVLEESLGDA
jgi:hypothetical protein